MVTLALGFVFGAWLLQQQAVLPSLHTAWILVPSLLVLIKIYPISFKFPVQKIAIFLVATLFGFFWAATFATIRLSDELPREWEQKRLLLWNGSIPFATPRALFLVI